MQLNHVTIENFRCYQQPTTVNIDDLTVLVGKNDAGKSAVFDALNVFFGNVKLDSDDRTKQAAEDADITITCEFTNLQYSFSVSALIGVFCGQVRIRLRLRRAVLLVAK
jgi:predicted ATP-dependent endonuclease of OLD family